MKHTPIVLALVTILLLGAACQKSATTNTNASQSSTGPDLLLKSIGVDLETYDPATNHAGDFEFTKSTLGQNRVWMDFGYVIPAAQPATHEDKPNPQPTFILPPGTKVHALVDGVVTSITELYSHDFSIMVASSKTGSWFYETEHVLNPLVHVGDRVTAGQVIAEVSTWDQQFNSGFGMFEIGILHGATGGPQHLCPFAYLDPSIKSAVQQKIRDLYTAWETYKGDTALYDEAAMSMPGCEVLEPIKG